MVYSIKPEKVRAIIEFAESLKVYEGPVAFDGPALYFHLAAMEDREVRARCECVYAMLVSWGMHRMGKGGAKMGNFDDFYRSVEMVWPEIEVLRSKRVGTMQDADWKTLREVFLRLEVMKSESKLVGHSKVLAHLLPEIVGPIDRAYTLDYLFGSSYDITTPELGADLFIIITRDFYHVVASDEGFYEMAKGWVDSEADPWDSSVLKVVDNLVCNVPEYLENGCSDDCKRVAQLVLGVS